MKIEILISSFFLFSCAVEQPISSKAPQNQAQSKSDSLSSSMSSQDLLSNTQEDVDSLANRMALLGQIQTLQTRLSEAQFNKEFFSQWKETLCSELLAYRQSCPASARLEEPLAKDCVGLYPASLSLSLQALQNGGTAEVAFQGANSLKAENIGIGSVKSNLSFRLSSNHLSPRVFELGDLKISAVLGTNLGGGFAGVELFLNQGMIANMQHASYEAGSRYLTLPSAIFSNLKNMPGCKVDPMRLEQLKSGVKSKIAQKDVQNIPVGASYQDLINLKTSIEKETQILETDLSRHRDLSDQFLREIQGQSAKGCLLSQKIETFEILISGSHEKPKEESKSSTKKDSLGNPSQINFEFGNNIVYSHADEEALPLFATSGKITVGDFVGKYLGDLEYIKIEKNGIGYQSVYENYQNKRYIISETNRYSLKEVSLKVNGVIVYQKTLPLGFVFEKGNLMWVDNGFRENNAFIQSTTNTSCTP